MKSLGKKILIVQHINFINGSGGTEKICCFLANQFSKLGFEVEVATNENIEGKPIFFLQQKVKVINIFNPKIQQKKIKSYYNYNGKNLFLWIKFKIKKKIAKFTNRILFLKMGGYDNVYKYNLSQRSSLWNDFIIKSNPDIIITMSIGSLLEITFKKQYNIPIVNSVNGRPDYDYTDLLWYRSKIDIECLKESYKHLSGIQVLFESYKSFLPNTFKELCKVIPNPVPQSQEMISYEINKERYKIVHIGTLVASCKQQDVAIEAFSRIANKYSNWDLYFYGTGVDYFPLKNLINKKKLTDRIFLMGHTNKPLEELKSSDIFIFPSKYEGFPLALTEAMSVGLPSIGLKSCSGVNELIKHKENGFLAENELEITQYLELLIKKSEVRKNIGENAKLAMSTFTEEYVAEEWEKMIKAVLN